MADAASAAQDAPQTTVPAAHPPAVGVPDAGRQPEPQKTEAAAPTPEQRDAERRAAALARAKRESQRVHQEREAFAREKAEHADLVKQAQEFQRLTDLKTRDPIKFLEEIQLSVPELSKQFLAKSTGAGKSPAELVKEEVDRRLAADAQARDEAAKKAQDVEQKRLEQQHLAGALKQMADVAKASPDKYELVIDAGQPAIDRAWDLCVRYHAEKCAEPSYAPLDFSKALDAIEADEEERLLRRMGGKKAASLQEKLKAEAAEKAKQPQTSSAKSRNTVVPRPVETESKSPVAPPKFARSISPTRISEMAAELWNAQHAKQDN